MLDRRTSVYLASSRAGRRREPFRTAHLNAAGWAAVGGLCILGAATGLAVTHFTGAAPWITAPLGAATAFAVVLAADRRKWAGKPTTHTWTGNVTEVREIASALQGARVDVSVQIDGFGRPALRYRNGDRRRIARACRDAGLPPP